MSANLKKNWCFIQLLTSTTVQQKLALLKTLTDNQLVLLCEIVLNTLQGQLYIPADTVKRLKTHKTFLRSLTSKAVSNRKKKDSIIARHRLIVQLIQVVKPLLETYMKE